MRAAAGTVGCVVSFVLALATAGSAPAGGNTDGASTARCWSVGTTTISPGLRLLEHARVNAQGRAVPHCGGKLRGYDVTGPGELHSDEVIEGSCRGGEGTADITIRLPTSGGIQEIRVVAPFSYTGRSASATARCSPRTSSSSFPPSKAIASPHR